MRPAVSSSAAARRLPVRLLPSSAARLASSVPPTPPSPDASPSPPAPASPVASSNSLRALLSDTAAALAHVEDLTKADSVWQRRLGRALAKLDEREQQQAAASAAVVGGSKGRQAGDSEQRELTVYGAPLSGSDRILLALLEDPLADGASAAQRAALEEMVVRSGKGETLSIEYGSSATPVETASEIHLASSAPFLQSSPALKLSFLPPSTSPGKALSTLLLAPTPVLVLDSLRLFAPFTQPAPVGPGGGGGGKPDVSVLQALLRHPNLKLVVNRVGGLGGSLATDGPTKPEFNRLRNELAHLAGYEPDVLSRLAEPGRLTWVDVALATEGYHAWQRSELASGGSSADDDRARALGEFTDKVVGSNLAALQFSLSTPAPCSRATAPAEPAQQVVPFLVDLALDSARFDLLAYDTHLQNHSLAAKALTGNAANLATQFFTKALTVPTQTGTIAPAHGAGSRERRVSEEVVGDVRGAVGAVLGKFGWPGMVVRGRVDDVGEEVADAVRVGWGGEGEKLLIFQTGVLSVLQQSLASSLNRVLSDPPHPSLRSAVLLNDLPRLPTVTPGLFLAPIQNRLNQLLASQGGPIAILQLRAQNAVRTTYALAASSVGGAYAGWFVELAGAESAFGLGALGALVGARFGLARWEKAKRKFWLDFDRVQDGLEEDLQKNMHQVVSDTLLERPRKAVEGMEALVVKRRTELESRIDEVERLRARLATLPVRSTAGAE